jgi:hypothetical protein
MPDNPPSKTIPVNVNVPHDGTQGIGPQVRVSRRSSTSKFKSVAHRRDVGHLIELTEDLRAIATTSENSAELIHRFLDTVSTRSRLFGVAWVELTTDGPATITGTRFKNPAMDTAAMRQELAESAVLAIQSPAPQIPNQNRFVAH